MSIITKWIDGALKAKRVDGAPLTDQDRAQLKRRAKEPGVSIDDALGVFNGGIIVRLDLECTHCEPEARIIKAKWPDHERWQCHFCGGEARTKKENESGEVTD